VDEGLAKRPAPAAGKKLSLVLSVNRIQAHPGLIAVSGGIRGPPEFSKSIGYCLS